MSDYRKICPICGAIHSHPTHNCVECGHALSSSPPQPSSSRRGMGTLALPEFMRPLVKIGIIIAIVALIAGAIYFGATSLYDSIEDSHPHPTDPAETSANFFYGLQDQDYQTSYRMLVSVRKTLTTLKKQQRQTYEDHFDRIREYLIKYVGPDFAENMEIDASGQTVHFAPQVDLTVTLEVSQSMFGEKNHYGIRQINEFPIDIAPSLGMEERSRHLTRAIEGLGDPGTEDYDDLFEIVRDRTDESSSQRLNRFLLSFKYARQLDTRHGILEWIVKEFCDEPQTKIFLRDLTHAQKEPPQIRAQAARALGLAIQSP